MPERRSPLDTAHRALGAKMVPFSGWEMPLSYPTGTLAEHRTCRTGAVVFDVSHLGTVRLRGPEAYDRIQRTLTNDLRKVAPGRAQYTHLLGDDGSVLDDIIVWWVARDEFHVMHNAANTQRVRDAIGGEDVTAERAVLAVQGPEARRWLADVLPAAADVARFAVATVAWEGVTCVVAGTGYTGEEGVEIAVPAAAATALWEALLDAGILPAGLGARDTLRLEAGLPLHGHELGPGITPAQAGLDWVVAWGKGNFRGRDALEAERKRGVERILRGLEVEGRQPPRAGYKVIIDGAVVGEVTSGNFSPTLGRGIALAFVPPPLKAGASVSVDARGQRMPARVVYPPFVARRRG
ncbi:MAG TPA: glycine cleavage system aminomethyltransferase GcvT [Acidimicrobiales bacterium]|nr:glycine cleavage system aminomethyltransferase GcvT [Acidimicrobiales bacterium]